MRIFLVSFTAMLATVLSACDAGVSASPGGGGGGGNSGECSPATVPTNQCNPTVQCVTATLTCSCGPIADADAGSGFTCSDASGSVVAAGSVPVAPPAQGACCDIPDLTCGGWDICAPICRCEDGAWSCREPDCPLFFCPDSASELAGKRCDDRIGGSCMSSVGGCFDVCTCMLRPGMSGGVWECSGPLCSFDGGTPMPGDAGPSPADGGMP